MADPDNYKEDLHFGELVVSQGLASRAQVDECLAILKKLIDEGASPVPRLGGLLVQKGFLGRAEMERTVMLSQSISTSELDETRNAPEGIAPMEVPPSVDGALKDPRNIVEKYVKVDAIGRGGMGEVWKAWDRELGRWVALKFLREVNERDEARFRHEAQAAAKLDHPNICAVYAVGRHDGQPYIALQYLEGDTLQTFPRHDRHRLAEVIRDVARAVQRAHDGGIIHRDIKPANIMVGSQGRVHVMDFGLATQSSHPTTGQVVGTPAYMSPEQARGESDLDGRSDVYSIGATFYELLTGIPPFQGTDMFEVIQRVDKEDPVSIRKMRPGVDKELTAIIQMCMEKDREYRYATAQELAKDLERWLQREPVVAHPPSFFYRLKKKAAKYKAMTALAFVIVAVGVAAAIVVPDWIAATEQEKKKDRKLTETLDREKRQEEELQRARPHMESGRRVVEQILLRLRDADRTGDELRGLAKRAEDEYRKAFFSVRAVPEAQLGIGRAYRLAGDRAKALSHVDSSIQADPTYAPAYLDRVRLKIGAYEQMRHLSSGKVRKESEEARVLREAIESDLARAREHVDDIMEESFAEGLLAFSQGDYKGAALHLEKYLKMAPADGEAHYARGHALFHLRRYREAVDEFTQAVKCDALDFTSINNRATALQNLGKGKEAIRDYDIILRRFPEDRSALERRADVKASIGDVRGALKDYTSWLRLEPGSWRANAKRGTLHARMGNFKSAIPDMNRAILLRPKDGMLWYDRGTFKMQLPDYKSAIRDFDQALKRKPKHAEAYVNRGICQRFIGDTKSAMESFDRAVELGGDLFQAWYNRGNLRGSLGDHRGAESDFTEALRLRADWQAHLQRAVSRHNLRKWEGAISDYEKVLKLAPADWPHRANIERDLKSLKKRN